MISDSRLMKISFTMAIAGVVALFFITQSIEPLETSIDALNDGMAGRNVIVHGTLSALSERNGNVFMTLENNSKISAVVFENGNNANKNLTIGMNITVAGRVTVYKGEIEIIVKHID